MSLVFWMTNSSLKLKICHYPPVNDVGKIGVYFELVNHSSSGKQEYGDLLEISMYKSLKTVAQIWLTNKIEE